MKLLPLVLVPVCLLSVSACRGGDELAPKKKGADVPLALTVVDGDIEIAEDASGVIPFELVANGEAGEYAFSVDKKPAHGKLAIVGGKTIYTPAADYNGPDTIEYSASRGEQKSNTGTVSITVTPVNDLPAFTGKNIISNEDAGPVSLAFATGISAGHANESKQVLTFSVSSDNAALFSTQPAVNAATGKISFAPANNANGVANLAVTLSDGIDAVSHPYTLTVLAGNDAPTLTSATITSVGNPAYGTDATFYVNGWVGLADIDAADSLSLHYQWKVAGLPVVGQTAGTLSGAFFAKGETVSVDVIAFDGTVEGDVRTAGPATIINTLPSFASVDIGVGPVYQGGTITAAVFGYNDADGDGAGAARYRWFVNGAMPAVTATTSDLNWGFAKGDTVTVTAAPFDGTGYGADVIASMVTIVNYKPVMDALTISADLLPAAEGSTISYTATGHDNDPGETVSFQLDWRINGSATGISTATLTSASFQKGDVVTLRITPFDGSATGIPRFSNAVTIQNTAPAVPVLTLLPSVYIPGNTLYVTVSAPGTDADGDAVTHTYQWLRDGVIQGFPSGQTSVSASFIRASDLWKVIVISTDGSTAVTASAEKAINTWLPINAADPDLPAKRYAHVAVWSGSEMLVWGGVTSPGGFLRSGGRYDPVTDTWKVMDAAGTDVPTGGFARSAVWSGRELIVWGGIQQSGFTRVNKGGRYSPATNSWVATDQADPDVPSARSAHAAIWTGREMIVWGGSNGTLLNSGGRYDPLLNTWTPTDTADVDLPSIRSANSLVWTGSEMIVWGGSYASTALNSGGRYDPVSNTWAAVDILDVDLPAARYAHQVIWTGREMIVWGGIDTSGAYLNTGARYDPKANSWTAINQLGVDVPSPRRTFSTVWTGREMIVWGGKSFSDFVYDTGARYDPVADSWQSTGPAGTAVARAEHSAVWTGREMIVWGGHNFGDVETNQGWRYTPPYAVETAVAMPIDVTTPTLRSGSISEWTGSEMLIWSGWSDTGGCGTHHSDGARFNPVLNAWLPITSTGAPLGRTGGSGHHYTAHAWTGSQLLVWGGYNSCEATPMLAAGGAYNPTTNAWETFSAVGGVGEPSPRYGVSSAWTGSEMIVYGGTVFGGARQNNGKAYNPFTLAWRNLSVPPSGGIEQSPAVWTGKEMLLWGGYPIGSNSGLRYDPAGDTWQAMAVTTTAERFHHGAVWTGNEMVILGGNDAGGTTFNDGARYFPEANTWSTLPASGLPNLEVPVMVWTGREVIVSDGDRGVGAANSMVAYDPRSNTWASMTASGNARTAPSYEWTGKSLLIWGGDADGVQLNTGFITTR